MSDDVRTGTLLGRRRLLKVGFWSLIGVAIAGFGATIARFLYPTGTDDDRTYSVAPNDVPRPGGPAFQHNVGGFFLVNLLPDEASGYEDRGDTIDIGPGGVLAVSARCSHLGCSVKFETHPAPDGGWGQIPNGFTCHCHGATFSKAGARRFGPTLRGLSTAQCVVSPDGFVTVDMARLKDGADDNAQRVQPYPS